MRSPLRTLTGGSIAAFCILAATFLISLPTQATVLWSADISRGTSVFALQNIDEPGGTITVAPDPLGQYGNVYKFYLPDETNGFGKERTESSGTETPSGEFRPAYNTEYYIGWNAMWNPMPINPGWVALFQMHGYGVSGQGAPLVLRAVNGDGNLYMQNGANGVDTNFWHMKFHTNIWQSFVLHVFMSTNPAVGYTEIWVNGVQQTMNNGQTRWYGPTWDNVDGSWQDSYNKLKWGVYRSGAMDGKGPATAYMSGAKVGTTYADVDPTGGGTIALAPTPTNQVVAPGNSAVYNVGVTLTSFNGTVNFSATGLPAGAGAVFNPASLTNSGTTTLTVTTTAGTTAIGSSLISIIANGGTTTNTNHVMLIVSGITLAASPASQSVLAGNSTNFTVAVTTNSFFTGTAALGITGLPAAATAGFNPASLGQSGTSALTIQTSTNTPSGAYPLTIYATNGASVVTTNVTLNVTGLSALPGTLVWTAASGAGTNWSTLLNWTNITSGNYGPPGVSNNVVFTNTATAAAAATVDNVMDSSVAISGLSYTHTNRFHNTLLVPGTKLTIATNLSVGTATDVGTNCTVYASLGGAGASLMVTNTNCVVSIRQGTGSGTGPYLQRATLDMSGLDTLNVKGSRLLVAADGGVQSRETGTLLLAKTNTITLYGSAPAIDMGENPGNGAGANNDPTVLTSYLYLGVVNNIFADSLSVGRSKGAGVLMFNSNVLGSSPTLYLRGTAGGRVATVSIGDESALGNSNQRSSGVVDFSGGTVDAMIGTAYVGQSMNGTNTGTAVSATGTLTFDDGTMDINTLEAGYQTFGPGTGPGCVGAVNVNGNALLLVNQTLELAHGSANSPAEQGNLNLNGGTVQCANIIGGGGTSTINVNSGTLDLQLGSLTGVSTLRVGTNNAGGAAALINAAGISVSGAITVAANGTISGSTILNDAGLNVLGQIAPGGDSSGGMTNNGAVTFGAGGNMVITVQDALGGPVNGWSFLGATSINVQSLSAAPFVIGVQTSLGEAANFDFTTNYDWVIATASGGLSNFDPSKFSVDVSQFANDLGGGYFYVRAQGNSLILAFTNNHPPAAQTTWLYRAGSTTTIPLSTLAANWSDPDGDPVALAGLDASSTNGVNNLSTDGTNIYYTNFNAVADSFSYTVQDIRTNPPAVYQPGDTVQTGAGIVNLIPPPAAVPLLSSNSLVLSGTGGKPNGNYYVLCSSNMTLPLNQWTIVATNSFDSIGNFNFTNPVDPGQPQLFYLLQLP
jgi:hypothetical protein